MPEENYMNKPYCLECMVKHLSRAEHHGEDLVTASRDNPELRQKAQEILDQTRDMRKQIDEMRVNELAMQKLKGLA
jgi:TolA-binding protein